MQNREIKGSLLLLTAGALWGTIGPFIRIMEQLGSDSVTTSLLRMLFAFFILFLFTFWRFGISVFIISGRSMFTCALLGLICHGIYNIFYSNAVNLTGIGISAILLNIAPVFTAAASYILFHENITAMKSVALVINVAGCSLAATGGELDASAFSLWGITNGLLAGLCYGLTAIFGRIGGDNNNVFVMSTYSYLFAAIFLALRTRAWETISLFSRELLTAGFLYALIPTAIAYLFYYKGLLYIRESSKVPVLASVEMIVACVIAVAAFDETMNAASLSGIVLMLVSIALMSRCNK